jgi:hypothetical protein
MTIYGEGRLSNRAIGEVIPPELPLFRGSPSLLN